MLTMCYNRGMKRVLLTGGCGFVGHHFVEHFIKNTDWHIVILDKLTYAGTIDRLRDIDVYNDERITLLTADFNQPITENLAYEIDEVDFIFHLGAQSHVDRSIQFPTEFAMSNVVGTVHMLNFARTRKHLKAFFYFSTDEVFGSVDEGFSEIGDPHHPSNPYSASKSAAEMFCIAYQNTYDLPIVITRSMNIFGERQDPEKFIPLCIRKIWEMDTVTIHANADKTKAGSRFYIHARNVADGYMHLINQIESYPEWSKGNKNNTPIIGGEFHITGEQEVDNLELAQKIADIMGKPLHYDMVDFHSSRPGHDLRYALSPKSMQEIGWEVPQTFDASLEKTIKWTLERPEWYGNN